MTSADENYSDLYHKVMKNKEKFEAMLNSLYKNNDECLQMLIAQMALTFATYNNTGYFYSKVLEDFYVDLAEEHYVSLSDLNYQKDSFLHVMTQCYPVGGHTRVVERWIENSSFGIKHSVVLINQNDISVPDKLLHNIKKRNGEFFLFGSQESQVEKALKLRRLGMGYEYIVLHIHMDDPVATIAFGNKEFKRPIIFFNHARHLFWIGKRISDVVADFMLNDPVSLERKLLKNIYKLPIPVDLGLKSCSNKIIAKNKLGIPLDKKIIVTAGSKYKYDPIYDDKIFLEALDAIMEDETVLLYVIGPDGTEKTWENLLKKYNERVIFLGYVSYENGYNDYIISADVFLDSYPVSGGTVCVDAIRNSCPFLSLCTVFGNIDFVRNSDGFCSNKGELISKTKRLLNDPEYSLFILKNEEYLFKKDHSYENWNSFLENILHSVNVHKISNLSEEQEPIIIDNYCLTLNKIYHRNSTDFLYVDKFGVCVKDIGFYFFFRKKKYITVNGKLSVVVLFGLNIKYKHEISVV